MLKFDGFLAVYEETPDEKAPSEAERGGRPRRPTTRRRRGGAQLPPLAEGDVLEAARSSTPSSTSPSRRRASARRRWSRSWRRTASAGPSTYASIIATIEAREYMEKREGKLYPTELGFLVPTCWSSTSRTS